MVFSKREKIIITATIAALCLLALDAYVLTPAMDERQALTARRTRLLAKMAQAQSLLERRRVLNHKWRTMLADGLKDAPAEAESQLLHSLGDWCSDARVRLSSLRPERSAEKSELPEVTVHAAGTGSMASISRLLWRIEKARIPAKIKMLQLGSRKDGTDDLSLHVKVSTLYSPSPTGRAARTTRRGEADRPARTERRGEADRPGRPDRRGEVGPPATASQPATATGPTTASQPTTATGPTTTSQPATATGPATASQPASRPGGTR